MIKKLKSTLFLLVCCWGSSCSTIMTKEQLSGNDILNIHKTQKYEEENDNRFSTIYWGYEKNNTITRHGPYIEFLNNRIIQVKGYIHGKPSLCVVNFYCNQSPRYVVLKTLNGNPSYTYEFIFDKNGNELSQLSLKNNLPYNGTLMDFHYGAANDGIRLKWAYIEYYQQSKLIQRTELLDKELERYRDFWSTGPMNP